MTTHHIYTHDPAYGETMMRYSDSGLDEIFGPQGADILRAGKPLHVRGMTWIHANMAARARLRAPTLDEAIAATDKGCVEMTPPHGRDVVTAWTHGRIRNNTHACAIIAYLMGRLRP